jgi:predicted phosphoribosyltransferase
MGFVLFPEEVGGQNNRVLKRLSVPIGRVVVGGFVERLERRHAEAEEVVVLEAPPRFSAARQCYESLERDSDEEAMAYLER